MKSLCKIFVLSGILMTYAGVAMAANTPSIADNGLATTNYVKGALTTELAKKQAKSTADYQVGNKDGGWTSISDVIVADGTDGPVKVTEQTDKKLKISVDKAADRTLGLVAPGDNINVDEDGEISVATGTPSQLGVVKVGEIPSGGEKSTTYATIWVQ